MTHSTIQMLIILYLLQCLINWIQNMKLSHFQMYNNYRIGIFLFFPKLEISKNSKDQNQIKMKNCYCLLCTAFGKRWNNLKRKKFLLFFGWHHFKNSSKNYCIYYWNRFCHNFYNVTMLNFIILALPSSAVLNPAHRGLVLFAT
jgi:hypothetical protein